MSVTLRWLDDIFLVPSRLRLSLYTILAYFLLSWTTLVRKNFPCGPFPQESVYYDLIRSSTRPSPSPPFHVVPPSISSFFPATGVQRSATLRYLSTR